MPIDGEDDAGASREARPQRKLVKPAAMFASWHFAVPRHFWPAFDVIQTERIFNRRPRLVWTQGVPPAYDFHEGDIFHSRDRATLIQVTAAGAADGVRSARYRRDVTSTQWIHVEDAQHQPSAFADYLRGPARGTQGTASTVEREVPFECRMTYVDADGVESERPVMIQGVRRSGQQAIIVEAIDRTEGRAKTFRLDRIVVLVDLETGEVIDTDDLRALL